jgi:hypothetical protein
MRPGGGGGPACDEILEAISRLLLIMIEAETDGYFQLQELLSRYFEWVEPPRKKKANPRGRRGSVKSVQELHLHQQQVRMIY